MGTVLVCHSIERRDNMSGTIDNQTKEILAEAIEGLKAFRQKLHAKREQRLWKKVSVPCDLTDALSLLTKNQLTGIYRNLDLKNLSSLNKPELVLELARLIPLKLEEVLRSLDEGRYSLVKAIAENSGVMADVDISVSHAETLMEYSIVFPGINDNEKILYMPRELVNAFWKIDGPELENTVCRNTEWILLTHGLLYYYGVAGAFFIRDKVEELTEQEIDMLEFMNVISSASEFYEQVFHFEYGYRDHRVFDAIKIHNEHNRRANLHYYPFTKEQLLKAGELDYIDRTPAIDAFLGFLLQHYELSDQEIDEIAMQLINVINMGGSPMDILEYLQSWFEFPSFDFVQELTANIMELHDNTRQWVLKGHTPNELPKEEREHFMPLPTEPFRLEQEDAKVIDLRTRTKVGRNDLCPCGSGKKYKKCCGRKYLD